MTIQEASVLPEAQRLLGHAEDDCMKTPFLLCLPTGLPEENKSPAPQLNDDDDIGPVSLSLTFVFLGAA